MRVALNWGVSGYWGCAHRACWSFWRTSRSTTTSRGARWCCAGMRPAQSASCRCAACSRASCCAAPRRMLVSCCCSSPLPLPMSLLLHARDTEGCQQFLRKAFESHINRAHVREVVSRPHIYLSVYILLRRGVLRWQGKCIMLLVKEVLCSLTDCVGNRGGVRAAAMRA